jgi:response regulator of citrate/malate metabolism
MISFPKGEKLGENDTKSILILDDDLIVTEILGQLVKNLGHYPIIAHNAPILASNKVKDFDIIVLDLWLSDSSSFESLQMLADQEFRGDIILISGLEENAMEEARREADELGLRITGYLRKPVSTAEFNALLEA